MKETIIAAALKEMEIHSLRFTIEDLTRRLHIGRNSLYKVVSSKDALIKSVVEYKIAHFAEAEEKILAAKSIFYLFMSFGSIVLGMFFLARLFILPFKGDVFTTIILCLAFLFVIENNCRSA